MTIQVSPSVVRVATPDDYQEVWRLFLQGHNENGIFKLAPDKVDYFLQRALHPELIGPHDSGPRGQVVVIGPTGHLEALCFVLISQFWYSHQYVLEELLVYIDPEFRKSSHAKAILEWMKKTSDELQIPVFTGIISTVRTEAKVRLYKQQLPQVGAFFLYPLQVVNGKQANHLDKEVLVSAK